jgi:hypothetical protein
MPQVSMYLDDRTHKLILREARRRKMSVSRTTADILNSHLSEKWPDDYFDLFGSIKDSSFARPRQPDFSDDSPRMTL